MGVGRGVDYEDGGEGERRHGDGVGDGGGRGVAELVAGN